MYRDVTLLQASGDEKIFFLAGDTKHWIHTEEVFISYNYDWGDVVEVPLSILNSYISSDAITEPKFTQ